MIPITFKTRALDNGDIEVVGTIQVNAAITTNVREIYTPEKSDKISRAIKDVMAVQLHHALYGDIEKAGFDLLAAIGEGMERSEIIRKCNEHLDAIRNKCVSGEDLEKIRIDFPR